MERIYQRVASTNIAPAITIIILNTMDLSPLAMRLQITKWDSVFRAQTDIATMNLAHYPMFMQDAVFKGSNRDGLISTRQGLKASGSTLQLSIPPRGR